MDEKMTVKDVAALLGVKPKTVLKWIREGRLKSEVKPRRRTDGRVGYIILISDEDLADFEVYNYTHLCHLDKSSRKAERDIYLTMLDKLEEELYDNACLICEMREKLEKIEL